MKNVENFRKELLKALNDVFYITELFKVTFEETNSTLINPIRVESYRKVSEEQNGIYLTIDNDGDCFIYKTNAETKQYDLVDCLYKYRETSKLSYMFAIVNKLTREVDF